MKEKIIIVIVVLALIIGVAYYLNMKKIVVNNPTTSTTVTTPATGPDAANVNLLDVSPIVSTHTSGAGQYLTDAKGLTLYVFADDSNLKSNCEGDCLKKWPPFVFDGKNLASTTDSLSKRMNVLSRSDGSYQYAYGQQPVYYYVGDKNPGDTNGVSAGVVSKWSMVIVK